MTPPPPTRDAQYLEALRTGDDLVIAGLVRELQPALLRAALAVGASRAVAEEVVQETWVVVLEKHGAFEGRSALRTWIIGTAINVARRRRDRERRWVPVGTAADLPAERGAGRPATRTGPEAAALLRELTDLVEDALRGLPQAQRRVVHLRDVLGVPAEDVCRWLRLSHSNQRVILHRGRRRVRAALAGYGAGGAA